MGIGVAIAGLALLGLVLALLIDNRRLRTALEASQHRCADLEAVLKAETLNAREQANLASAMERVALAATKHAVARRRLEDLR